MGNYWSVTPCDANGQAVANLTSDGNGYYGMTSGIESEQVSNTYPVAMVAAAVANPGTYGDYLQSAFPLGISPSLRTFSLPIYAPNPITVLGGNFGEGNAVAYNYVSRGSGAYTYSVPSTQGPPLTGPINGSLTQDLSGQLRFYWRVQWMGMGTPTVPMPKYLSLCVKANLTATASVGYNNSFQRNGLSAQATASDQVNGNGFGDAVSASAGDTGTLPGSSITKYHLVSAAVLPLAGSTTTGIAQAYLNGSTHTFVNNSVQYLIPDITPVLNGSTQAYASVTVAGGVKPDDRTVTVHREGAHNETQDPDGTVHGDTTFSYFARGGGPRPVTRMSLNVQKFYPSFGGAWPFNPNYVSGGADPVYKISWLWSPQFFDDTWASQANNIDFGTLYFVSNSQEWHGTQDAVKTSVVTYTAKDLTDGAVATGNYVLRIHDIYDSWRRVDSRGNSMSANAPGDNGSLVALSDATTPLPGTPVLSIHDAGVDWTVVGMISGSSLSAGSMLLLTVADPPIFLATVIGLAGLGITTVSSLPTDPHFVSPPGSDHFDATSLQVAYQNYVHNLTALPGESINTNLISSNFYNFLKLNPDFAGFLNGNYGVVKLKATVSQRMSNYYIYANGYDQGGITTTTAPSVVHRPGGYVWNYEWTYPN